MNHSILQNPKNVVRFKKWGRKNYSLFSVLNKIVSVSVLSVVYLLSVPAVSIAQVQDSSDVKMKFDLEEIEVSAQRSPALYSEVARIITVISSKEIEAAPVQNIQDLLEYISGVDVRQRGAGGMQADVSIRGGTFDQALVLLNGINITDPQTGHHNFNLPVSFDQIQRIEILEGPAGRIYGPNAFSGAINIITYPPGSKSAKLSLSGGSFRYLDASASGGFNTGKLNHLLAVNHKSSTGYIDNTDFQFSNLFYSNQVIAKKGIFSFQGGISEKAFGANSFYTPVYPNQFENTGTYFSSAKWKSKTKLHLTPAVYWRRHNDRFELFRNNAPDWYKSHNYHRTDVFGGNLNSWIQWKWGRTAFGVEIRSENILSNVLGEELDKPVKVPNENAYFSKSKSRTTSSVFFEHAYYYNNWIATAGLMGNTISESGLGWNFFPGLDLSYGLSSGLKIFTSYNTSLRMPTFTDLYYSGPTNIGNPDLKPEKSASLEGGVKLNRRLIIGHVVFFYRNGKNIIDWVKMSSDDIWQPKNLTRLKSYGAEFQVQFNLKDFTGKNLPDKLFISYYNNNQQKQAPDFISNYVLDNLKHKVVFIINQEVLRNISLNLNITFQDREGTFSSYSDTGWAAEKKYPPFWLFDAKANYRFKKLNYFVSVNNIFNTDYYDIGNVAQPGVWIKSGISYKFDFN